MFLTLLSQTNSYLTFILSMSSFPSRSSPEYVPISPEYRPQSPEYVPKSPEYKPQSPEYKPQSAEYVQQVQTETDISNKTDLRCIGGWEADGKGGWKRGTERADACAVILYRRTVATGGRDTFGTIIAACRDRYLRMAITMQRNLKISIVRREKPLRMCDVSVGSGADARLFFAECAKDSDSKYEFEAHAILTKPHGISEAKRRFSAQFGSRTARGKWFVRDVPTPLHAPALAGHRAYFEIVTCNLLVQEIFDTRKNAQSFFQRISNMLHGGGLVIILYPDGGALARLATRAKTTVVGPLVCAASEQLIRSAVARTDIRGSFGIPCNISFDTKPVTEPQFAVDCDLLAACAARAGLRRVASDACHWLATRISTIPIPCDDDSLGAVAASSLFRIEAFIKDITPEGAFFSSARDFIKSCSLIQ